MRGVKTGSGKNVSTRWNSNLDKFAIKWWLDKVIIEMNDVGSWEALKVDIFSYAVMKGSFT